MKNITGSGSSSLGGLGRDHVERQAVLAHRLVLADAEQRVLALLRCAVGEPVAVPHAGPRLDGLRRAVAQRADGGRAYGIDRQRCTPSRGETLDDAAVDGHANGAIVHDPTLAKNPAAAAPGGPARSAR